MPFQSFDFSLFLKISSISFGILVFIVLSIIGIAALLENNKSKNIRYLIFIKDKLLIINPDDSHSYLFIDRDRFIFYYHSEFTYKILEKDIFV